MLSHIQGRRRLKKFQRIDNGSDSEEELEEELGLSEDDEHDIDEEGSILSMRTSSMNSLTTFSNGSIVVKEKPISTIITVCLLILCNLLLMIFLVLYFLILPADETKPIDDTTTSNSTLDFRINITDKVIISSLEPDAIALGLPLSARHTSWPVSLSVQRTDPETLMRAQEWIRAYQFNNTLCSLDGGRLLDFDWGSIDSDSLGVHFTVMAQGLDVAMDNDWNFRVAEDASEGKGCLKQSHHCYFLPISTCIWNNDEDRSQGVHSYMTESLGTNDGGTTFDKHIPTEFDYLPWFWWVCQLQFYILQPNEHSLAYQTSQSVVRHNLQHPYVTIHMRSTSPFPLQDYMKIAQENFPNATHVFLMTDSASASLDMLDYPEYTFEVASFDSNDQEPEAALDFISNMIYATAADGLICTFSSSASRLIVKLRYGAYGNLFPIYSLDVWDFDSHVPRDDWNEIVKPGLLASGNIIVENIALTNGSDTDS